MPVDKARESAAIAAVNEQINHNVHIIGVGSGSTIVPAVKRIAELVKQDKLDLICVPTSLQARELILSNDLKLGSLIEYQELDVAIDGADEVDEEFNCIKGGGGCQTQEKLVAICAKKFIVIADEKKWSKKLGEKWDKGIPIEVLPVAYKITKKEIEKQLGGEVVVREGTGKLGPVLTDQGNFILDWKFDSSKLLNWSDVNQKLKMIPGVIETGLFVNMISKAYFGNQEGKVEIKTNSTIEILSVMTEYQLQNPPIDGITSVHFSPNNQSQFLIASSWDCSVRLYDVNQHTFRHMYKHTSPVLDCCFADASRAFSGGLDRILKMYDFTNQQETLMGYHDNAIRCVHYSPEFNFIITGSWDATIKFWDSRVQNCLGSCSLPDKVYTLDSVGEYLVIGTAQRKVSIWDLRKISNQTPIENRESNLKYQTRCIRCFPNKQGYVLSSIEGRVAVEFFDNNPEIQKKKYAFKCHRSKENGIENIFPVNAIAFHKQHGTFATGGSDAFVNMWDGANKKRLCQFHQYPAGITSLAFSSEGNMLAIASSYNYEYGADTQLAPNDITKNNIFVRRVSDLETKPK